MVVFLDVSPFTLWFTLLVLSNWKLLRWYIYRADFIDMRFIVPEFSILKCFRTNKDCPFRLLLGGFLAWSPPNMVKFVWKFDQWLNVRYCIRYDTAFLVVLKNGRKWAKEFDFLAHFRKFFDYTFFAPWKLIQIDIQDTDSYSDSYLLFEVFPHRNLLLINNLYKKTLINLSVAWKFNQKWLKESLFAPYIP